MQFNKFHNAIKLDDLKNNQPLRDKRNMLIKELRDWGKANDKPAFKEINQGSYSFGTGVKPLEGDDYDIDVGVIYDLDIDDYGPIEVKKWVRDALSKHNRTIDIKFPCVRVQYHKAGEFLYHVDFAIYGKKFNILGREKYLALAKGKEFSIDEFKYWEETSPRDLKDILNEKFTDKEERSQYKRCIRYLKRWKDHNFSSKGNSRPNGIAMTACAHEWFIPKTEKWNGEKDIDDLTALSELVDNICTHNYGLDITLPVLPRNPLFEALRENEAHEERYIKKMSRLDETLEKAKKEVDPHEAAKLLRKVFGEDFSVPPKSNTGRNTDGPAIAPSTESA